VASNASMAVHARMRSALTLTQQAGTLTRTLAAPSAVSEGNANVTAASSSTHKAERLTTIPPRVFAGKESTADALTVYTLTQRAVNR